MASSIVVIGAGAISLEIARALARLDGSVEIHVFMGRASVPSASLAAGAMVAPWSETTAESIERHDHALRHSLLREAREAWAHELDGVRVDGRPLISGTGSFLISNSVSGTIEDRNYRAIVQQLDADDVSYESVDPDEIPGFAPRPGARASRALYIRDEFTLDSAALHEWQKRTLSASPQVHLHDALARPLTEDDKLIGVIDNTKQVWRAEAVIIAAGVSSRAILPFDVRRRVPPTLFGAGSALVVTSEVSAALVSCIRTPNRAFACGLHVLPSGPNKLYIGATNNILTMPWARPSMSDVEALSAWSRTQINKELAHASVSELRAGNRPISADLLPTIGETSIAGLWMASGTFRDGLTMAPVIGDAIGRAILRDEDTLPAVWAPERPLSYEAPAQGAPQLATAHTMAVADEHEVAFDDAGMDEEVFGLYSDHFTRREESFGEALNGRVPPEVLASVEPGTALHREIVAHGESYPVPAFAGPSDAG
ncbi:NAD(P)/FAD-dependent oxidoreductase [Microbacterium sp. 2RAF4]|uniref:NAD(P)/FAD-dependent oxidoreductase n=1 Tax=Microbacterium sp. 2RAF4 TaxID=3232999 RepID=UPI003F9B8FF5